LYSVVWHTGHCDNFGRNNVRRLLMDINTGQHNVYELCENQASWLDII